MRLAHVFKRHVLMRKSWDKKIFIIIHSVFTLLHIQPSVVRFFSQSLKRSHSSGHAHNFSFAQNVFNKRNCWVCLRSTAVFKWLDTRPASMFLGFKIIFILINYSITIRLKTNMLPPVLLWAWLCLKQFWHLLARTLSAHTLYGNGETTTFICIYWNTTSIHKL